MERLQRQVKFVEEIEKLKAVTRFNRTIDGRFENSAEHSWQVALVSNLLYEYYPPRIRYEKSDTNATVARFRRGLCR